MAEFGREYGPMNQDKLVSRFKKNARSAEGDDVLTFRVRRDAGGNYFYKYQLHDKDDPIES